MTFILTPFSVSILFLYISLLCILPMLSDFYFYMLIIEMSILLFLGFMLLSFSNSFSSLIFFFLIQVFSSFNLLIGYTLSLESLIFLSLFLKTAFFPFISWFFNVSYRFPNLILCLVATVYKFPSLFVFYQFLNLSSSFLIISIILHFLAIASFMFVVNDLRLLLIVSSSASTAWFFLCLAYSPLYIFFSFYILYSLTLLLLFSMIGPLSKYLLSLSFISTNHRIVLFLSLSNLSAFPPFPLFLFKIAILYGFLFESSFLPFYESLLILLLNALIMVAYLKCYFKFLTLSYLSPTSIFLFLRLLLSYTKTFSILHILPRFSPLLLFSVTPAIALMPLDPDTLITVVSHADTTSPLSLRHWLFLQVLLQLK